RRLSRGGPPALTPQPISLWSKKSSTLERSPLYISANATPPPRSTSTARRFFRSCTDALPFARDCSPDCQLWVVRRVPRTPRPPPRQHTPPPRPARDSESGSPRRCAQQLRGVCSSRLTSCLRRDSDGDRIPGHRHGAPTAGIGP